MAKRSALQISSLELRELVSRELSAVAGTLRQRSALDEEIVHEARKSLKRARACLRLLRKATGKPFYFHQNAQLRDAARPLGHIRDSHVLMERTNSLLEDEKNPRRRTVLMKLRREIDRNRRKMHDEARREGTLEKSALIIEEAARRIKAQRIATTNGHEVESGIKRIYRKGRAALEAAISNRTDDNLHEFRKQTKYMGHAIKVLAPEAHDTLAKFIERVDAIGDDLGGDHDLVVLQIKIGGATVSIGTTQLKLLARINSLRTDLQRSALKQGKRLYKYKAGRFLKRLQTHA
jgi:CHAD domain-containing protein